MFASELIKSKEMVEEGCTCIYCKVCVEMGYEPSIVLCEGADPTCGECATWKEHYGAMEEDGTYKKYKRDVREDISEFFFRGTQEEKRRRRREKEVIPEKALPRASAFDPVPVYENERHPTTPEGWVSYTTPALGKWTWNGPSQMDWIPPQKPEVLQKALATLNEEYVNADGYLVDRTYENVEHVYENVEPMNGEKEAMDTDPALEDMLVELQVIDTLEARKMHRELVQAIHDRGDGYDQTPSVKTKSLQWRLSMLTTWAMLSGIALLPGASAETSAPEQYANAFYTVTWSLVVFMVFYTLSKVMLLLGTTLSQVMLTLCASMVAFINSGTALVNSVTGSVPGLVADFASYLRWMKYTQLAMAGAQVIAAVTPILASPFTLLRWLFKKGDPYALRNEGRYQQANRYGVLGSVILTVLMFIMVPVWGFAKSYKKYEPMRRMLEQLPYVTWFMDWLSDFAEGKATTASIPTNVRAFAMGEDIPTATMSPIFAWARGTESDGGRSCDVSGCLRKDCKDGSCMCRCHEKQEMEEAEDALACDVDGNAAEERESGAGLGHSQRGTADKVRKVFQRTMTESEESRKERWDNLRKEKDAEFAQSNVKKQLDSCRQSFVKAAPVREDYFADNDGEKGKDKQPDQELVNQGKEDDPLFDDLEARIRAYESADSGGPMDAQEQSWGEILWECAGEAQTWCQDNYGKVAAVLLAIGGVATVIAACAAGFGDNYVPEGHGKGTGNKPRTRWSPQKRKTKFTPRKRHDHLPTGGAEHELNREPEEHRSREMDRAEAEIDRMMDDGDKYYNKAILVEEEYERRPRKEGALKEKAEELGMKWFPARVDQAEVAARAHAIRAAKTVKKRVGGKQVGELFEKRDKDFYLYAESMLGKQRFVYDKLAANCVKVVHGDEETSSGTLIPGKVIVPLHSHEDGKPVSVYNYALSAQLRGEVIPLFDDNGSPLDLGFYHSYGAFSANGVRMRPPKNERVIQIGFTPDDESEPSFGVGFAAADGLYDAPTDFLVCGGGVYAVEDGALVGFHIGGGTLCNKFIPVTERMVEQLKAQAPSLKSSLFH